MPDGPSLTEVKQAQDNMLSAWEDFKEKNDARLKEIEKTGRVDPLWEDQLKRINAFVDEMQDKKDGLVTKDDVSDITKTQDELKAQYKERFDKLEAALSRPRRGSPEEGKHQAVEQKQMFLNWARLGPHDMDGELKKIAVEKKLLSVGNDTGAGYLAQPEWIQEIIKAETEMSPMRSLARVRSTGQTSIKVPKRTGQFAAVWTAERGTRSETEGLEYGLEEVPTHELYALVDITQQMLEDSLFNLEAELDQEFTEQFAVAEGIAFVTGDGSGKPEGILGNSTVGSTNSGSAATIADSSGQANGIIDLYHDIKTAYARNATWVLNRSTLGEVRKLKDGDNNYIWVPGVATLSPATILSAPFVEMPDMPDQGANTFPIAFGDFNRGYSIVDRISMSVLRDPFTQATAGAIRFIARRRVGGQTVLAEAYRKLKCST